MLAGAKKSNLLGAYIVSVNGTPIFTKEDAIVALNAARDNKLTVIDIEFALEKHFYAPKKQKVLREHSFYESFDPTAATVNSVRLDDDGAATVNSVRLDDDGDYVHSLSLSDLRSIASIRYPTLDFSEQSISSDMIYVAINAIRSDATTPEEQALGHFTRRKLKNLSTWKLWKAGEKKQLDQFHRQELYGLPIKRPPNAIVLRPHWQYHIKRDGTRRSRNCCDGSPKAAPILHGIASTYSSCVKQPIQRLFFSLCARSGFRVFGGDATDAFAHSPPPDIPTYVWFCAVFHWTLD